MSRFDYPSLTVVFATTASAALVSKFAARNLTVSLCRCRPFTVYSTTNSTYTEAHRNNNMIDNETSHLVAAPTVLVVQSSTIRIRLQECFTLAAYVFVALTASAFAAPEQRSGPGKRGLCWPWFNSPLNPGLFHDGSGSVNLIYDYETYAPPSSNGNGGLAFIGMQRCMDCDSSPIADLKSRQQELGFVTLFTLNEPDGNGISPASAAQWYIEYINPLAIKKSLPAVTSSTASGQGLSWVAEMISACAGQCYYDYINLHWYGQSLAEFESYVEQAHNQFPNTQIVITEFALQNPSGGQAAQVSFFEGAFSFLDGLSYVAMYFPFVATSPNLLSENDSGAVSFVGTGSTLYNNDGSISAAGKVMLM
uniref:Asl1-like glycosyl hydrolase catalytic domain-containing protein n=1 Tax=Mycena chlorophos TaxID=658473 RepID=A0ABQ0KWE3_MYCCL|nr:predicted protein [Mycena chlorophos]